MHLQRTLPEIVHDVVIHLDAGMSSVAIPEAEIADAIQAPAESTEREAAVHHAISQISLANDLTAQREAGSRVWVFRAKTPVVSPQV